MPALQIVILAAGKGTRMKSALPKVLHPLAGRSLLGHAIAAAEALDPAKVVVVYGHGGETVPLAFQGSSAVFVPQAPQLGTGHAVQQAVPQLDHDGVTLVLYGDVPLIQASTLRRVLDGAAELSVLTVHLADPTGYGRIVRDAAGNVLRIVEDKDADAVVRAIGEVNTGIIAAPSARLAGWLARLGNRNAQREYYLTDVIAMAVAEGVRVHTAQPANEWEVLGVNSRDQLAYLERVWQRENARRLMAAGVTLADPERIDVRGALTCGTDITIDVGCVFEGKVDIADDVMVGPNCVIKDCTIEAGTRIAAFSHLEGAHVGSNGRIGPYARLRPGARLANDVHVGNFVEIKASTLAEGAKANHLAYLGDSEIGRRVNIGAGTITCNYDGVNKHKTIIEDDAFIGSDTQLVAPVRVGRGATLGAGTTLTRDAPADQLTVSRARQVSIPGWKRPARQK
ncbi:MAG: bifunctional UDP-N-acetylglucosamine diphosphorylase/glucosamine-1-phosphate N-acetyltransferase GlmU [Betaproteobacteria bacterium]